MNISDYVNAIYTQSLSLKRFLDKQSIRTKLSEIESSSEVAFVEKELDRLYDELRTTADKIKHLSFGLNGIPLGDLRQLAKQLGLTPDYLSKDEVVVLLMDERRKKCTQSE